MTTTARDAAVNQLALLTYQFPQQRIGQLLHNALFGTHWTEDSFYLSDLELADALRAYGHGTKVMRTEEPANEVVRLREILKQVQTLASSAAVQFALPNADKGAAANLIAQVAQQAEDGLKTAGKEAALLVPVSAPVIDEEVRVTGTVEGAVTDLRRRILTRAEGVNIALDISQYFTLVMDLEGLVQGKLLQRSQKYRVTFTPVEG